MNAALVLPATLLCSSRVNFELRNGMRIAPCGEVHGEIRVTV